MTDIRSWWNQQDQFLRMTEFLHHRQLLRAAQMVIATVAASSAIVPAAALALTPRPSATELTLDVASIAVVAVVTACWLIRWPTRRQSRAVVITGMSCIAVFAVVQPSAELAAQAPAAMAVVGAYVAFFHGARFLVVNVAVAAAISMVAAIRLAGHTGPAAAVAIFWLVVFLNAAVPAVICALSLVMRTYAAHAQEDPMTGLLNRRGFTEAISHSLVDAAPGTAHLTVLMVDLDDFKRVNDEDGHAAGDAVLVDVADVLRREASARAIVCRCGGEEFLIATPAAGTDAESLATRVCSAIAQLPARITASVGLATLVSPDGRDVLDVEQVIATADSAMYAAKRRGGNQVERARLP